MVRFRSRNNEPEEEWYWERISVADKKPFRQVVALDGLVRQRQRRGSTPSFADALSESVRSAGSESETGSSRIRSQLDVVFGGRSTEPTSVKIRLGMRGWSEPRHRERDALPHHELEILFNGRPVSSATWDGSDHQVHEFEISSRMIEEAENELALKITKRMYLDSGDLLVDVVLLNWIELEYEHQPVVLEEQLRLRLADPAAGRTVQIRGEDDKTIDLYLGDGRRLQSETGILVAQIPDDVNEFSVLKTGAAAEPVEVILDRFSDLMNTDHQADYIMITHRSLEQGATRLADFHRSRGLAVDIVDVQDIYDEFNHGILAPTRHQGLSPVCPLRVAIAGATVCSLDR